MNDPKTMASSEERLLSSSRPWHALPVSEVSTALGTDPETGLDEPTAIQRLSQYGPNKLRVAKRTRWYQILARQFVDVLIAILLIAAVISFAIGETGDAMTIMAIVVLNGILGFVQEWKAEQAMAALQRMLAPICTVVREGVEQKIEARRLVPGDLVLLSIGDRVPADLRLIAATNLKIDESALTGESIPVRKDVKPGAENTPLAGRSCIAWMGTALPTDAPAAWWWPRACRPNSAASPG